MKAQYSVTKLKATATSLLKTNTEALAKAKAQDEVNKTYVDALTAELKIDKKTSLEKAAKINDLFLALAKETLPTKSPATKIPENGVIALSSAVKEIEVKLPEFRTTDYTKKLKAILRDLELLGDDKVDSNETTEFLLQDPEVFEAKPGTWTVKFNAPIPPVD